MLSRLLITLTNIIFPPLAVLLLTGPYTDTLLSCILFLCAIIPSHIHGFYISCTYFHRKNKVRRGRYPGGRKNLIWCQGAWRGGASVGEVEALRRAGVERERGKKGRGGKGEVEGGFEAGSKMEGGFGGGYGNGNGGVPVQGSQVGYVSNGSVPMQGSQGGYIGNGGVPMQGSQSGLIGNGSLPKQGSQGGPVCYGRSEMSQTFAPKRSVLGDISGRC